MVRADVDFKAWVDSLPDWTHRLVVYDDGQPVAEFKGRSEDEAMSFVASASVVKHHSIYLQAREITGVTKRLGDWRTIKNVSRITDDCNDILTEIFDIPFVEPESVYPLVFKVGDVIRCISVPTLMGKIIRVYPSQHRTQGNSYNVQLVRASKYGEKTMTMPECDIELYKKRSRLVF